MEMWATVAELFSCQNWFYSHFFHHNRTMSCRIFIEPSPITRDGLITTSFRENISFHVPSITIDLTSTIKTKRIQSDHRLRITIRNIIDFLTQSRMAFLATTFRTHRSRKMERFKAVTKFNYPTDVFKSWDTQLTMFTDIELMLLMKAKFTRHSFKRHQRPSDHNISTKLSILKS